MTTDTFEQEPRIQIIRVLLYTGTPDWVARTLERSTNYLEVGSGKIVELGRMELPQ